MHPNTRRRNLDIACRTPIIPIKCFILLMPSSIGPQTAGSSRETGAARCLVRPDQIDDPLNIVRKDSHAPMHERLKDGRRQLVIPE